MRHLGAIRRRLKNGRGQKAEYSQDTDPQSVFSRAQFNCLRAAGQMLCQGFKNFTAAESASIFLGRGFKGLGLVECHFKVYLRKNWPELSTGPL